MKTKVRKRKEKRSRKNLRHRLKKKGRKIYLKRWKKQRTPTRVDTIKERKNVKAIIDTESIPKIIRKTLTSLTSRENIGNRDMERIKTKNLKRKKVNIMMKNHQWL